MFIIKSASGDQFWTEKYQEKDGWLVFDTQTKKGKIQKHQVNKKDVFEIVETELNEE